MSVLRSERGDAGISDESDRRGVGGVEESEVVIVGCDVGLETVDSETDDRDADDWSGGEEPFNEIFAAPMCGLGVVDDIGVLALLAAAYPAKASGVANGGYK